MPEWKELANWLYGDVMEDRGFWYSHPLFFVRELKEEQLLWVPDKNCLCMLWHIGHIAYKERIHIGVFLQGLKNVVPPEYEIFSEWASVEDVRRSTGSVQDVFKWVTEVRKQSADFINSLKEEDWHKVPPASAFGLTLAHWLFITVSHGAIHLGKVQMMRAMLEGRQDSPC